MLVLSRHRDESIIIGDDIIVAVVDIRGDKVRLGIAAPIEISVHRQEVYEAIQRENRNGHEGDGRTLALNVAPASGESLLSVARAVLKDYLRRGCGRTRLATDLAAAIAIEEGRVA